MELGMKGRSQNTSSTTDNSTVVYGDPKKMLFLSARTPSAGPLAIIEVNGACQICVCKMFEGSKKKKNTHERVPEVLFYTHVFSDNFLSAECG